MAGMRDFNRVLTDAINDLVANGFDSMERVNYWTMELRRAATASMVPEHRMEQLLSDALSSIYQKMGDPSQVTRLHPGVSRFTLEKIRPQLRAELDRRIKASANLIVLNRASAIEKTMQRFQGWATSIPEGGSEAVDKPEVKTDMRKALKSLPFQERRVIIDQGHKLRASVGEIVAKDGGAIACTWHSHWRQAGYDYRVDHKERDGNIYLLKSSWAKEKGFVKPGKAGYYEDVTAVGEEVFCRCYATWIYNVRELPADMITQKGKDALEAARKAMEAA